jgi:hypothetical protein
VITQDINIPVETLNNKKYIAQNTYYKGNVSYDFGSLQTDPSGRITANINDRPYLEDVLSMFTNNFKTDSSGNLEYDFINHNVILPTDVLTGIPVSNSVTFDGEGPMKPYETISHTNQQIQFVVCDINTNAGQSALIGYFGVVDTKKTLDDTNDVETVRKIPSKLNGAVIGDDSNVAIGFNFQPDNQK